MNPSKSTHISQLNMQQNSDPQKMYNIVEDDDSTVIDALNHLNKSVSIDPSTNQIQMPAPPQIDQFAQQAPVDFGVFNDNQYDGLDMQMQMQMQNETVSNNDMRFSQMFSWTRSDDIKTALYVVIVFIIVSIIPIETTVYKYISLDKIPYSNVLLKAIIAGILVFLLKKLLK